LIKDKPPFCFIVSGPNITSRGFEEKESMGNLIDIKTTHRRGKIAIKHQINKNTPVIIFREIGNLYILLCT
tara:strand:+ start:132 stop:344 length:213 start_codon:yes stop_codon:yes gene_type:complete